MKTSLAAVIQEQALPKALLRADDFPSEEEQLSGFPIMEYRATVEYILGQQQERQQLAREDERVLLTLYQHLPELQEQITPPYGVRMDSGRANGRENWREKRPLEGRRIGGQVYEIPEIPLPISVRGGKGAGERSVNVGR